MKVKNKKKQIILFAIIFLLCVTGVGAFFLLNPKKPTTSVVMQSIRKLKGDVSWYSDDKDEFTLTTKEQLYGLAELSQEMNFKGKTIKLGADIVINEGNAKDWQDQSPELEWVTIGSAKYPFNGTFDGQGHTISGVYSNQSDDATGLFKQTGNDCQVKNFKIQNSYFKMLGDQGIGTVAGVGLGMFSQIYSDAIIECDGWRAGGIIGSKSKDGSCVISECWFDGEIIISGRLAGGIVGGVYAGDCTIQHCLNTGMIHSTFPGPQAATIGGIAGYVSGMLKLSDSFSNGVLYNDAGKTEIGAIIGSAGETAEVTAGFIWSTRETASTSIGGANAAASVLGPFLQLPEELLTGYHAYQRTDLDFEQFWTVVEDDTPMLRFFADKVLDVPDMERAIVADTSWYDVTRIENVITTPQQLKGFAFLSANGEKFYGKIIKLGANISYNEGKAEDYADDIPLNLWVPLDGFMGTFDGQGYTISGLFADCAADHVGMFAFTEASAVIKNFKLTNSYFERTKTTGNYGCASVAGAGGGTFERIYSNAIVVTGNMNGGGIVGQFNRNGSVSECWFDGEVAAEGRFAGGIVGGGHPYKASGLSVVTEMKIAHCLNTGYIHRTDKEATNPATYAGIIGLINNKATVEDCFNAGIVSSGKYEKTGSDELGAIVAAAAANSTATIKNCWGTTESFKKAVTTINKTCVSDVAYNQVMFEELLKGYNAVKFTTLNFKKYWSVDLDGTPMLTCFAKETPSIAGVITPDVSWYKENQSEYVIQTVAQLYGFSVLGNTGVTFEGKTVKLGNNITVNTGNAANWKSTPATNNWFPIKDFAGTFDGQGYTISGIYGVDTKSENIGRGLFSKTVKQAVLQNFRLVNSYFETQTVYAVAAVSSRGCGTFKNIYTDAIINNIGGSNTGGILGLQLWDSATIENCWFDGEITDVGRRIGGIVGYTGGHDTTIAHCLFSGTLSRVGDQVDENMALAGGIVGCAQGNVAVTDCLSVGKLSTERSKDDAVGSLIGEAVRDSEISLKTLYASESSYSKLIGYNGCKADVSGCTMVSDEYLTSESVSLFILLDYTNYWAVVKGTSPQLKSFASGAVIANPKRPDTSWYKADATSYTISDMEDLYGLRMLSETESFASKVINMSQDIVVNATKDGQEAKQWQNSKPSYYWLPIQNFAGEFNGNGFAISGLYGVAASGSAGGMGLFSKTSGAVNVHDVSLMNSYFESNDTNGLAGIASQASGEFKNIHTNVILYNKNTGNIYAGGIVGFATGTLTAEDCWSEATITGAGRYAGGILGYTNGKQVTIQHCLNTGNLHRFGDKVDGSRAGYGGIIGTATAGNTVTINDCLNTGNVTTDRTINWDAIGQIAAEGSSTQNLLVITNSYGVEGACVNGLVKGYDTKAKIESSAILAKENLLGVKAYQNTTLDFTDEVHWVVKGNSNVSTNEMPALEVFVPDENECELYGVPKYDTSWYSETTKTGTITDKWDLYGFAKLAKEGKLDAASIISLGNDIAVNASKDGNEAEGWKQIGAEYKWSPIENFAGEFNGNGYTISGLYGVASADTNRYMALFGKLTGDANVHDLHVANSYFASSDTEGLAGIVAQARGIIKNVHADVILYNDNVGYNRTGGIAGFAVGTLTIEDCWSESTVTVAGRFVGGILGHTNKQLVTIEHCLNSGNLNRFGTAVNSNRASMGGILGIVTKDKIVTINDCLNLGTVTTARTSGWDSIGSIAGEAPNAYNVFVISNSYALEGTCEWGLVYANVKYAGISNSEILAKEKLLGSAADTNTTLDFTNQGHWKVVAGKYPVLKVFAVKYDTSWYDVVTKTGTIMDAEDLYGFAKLAETGKLDAKSVITLGNDIVLNNVTDATDVSTWKTTSPSEEWTPIYDFAGTFDGGMHSIKGLYVYNTTDKGTGFFRSTGEGSTVKNLKIEKSYFYSSQQIIGSVVGSCSGNLENIYSSAVVDATAAYAGGIVGNIWTSTSTAVKPISINKCWFDGSLITTKGNNGCIVGIISKGYIEMNNCLNSGTLSFKDGFSGGLVGRTYNGSDKWGTLKSGTSIYLTMENCLNRGTMTGTAGKSFVGSIIGKPQSHGKFEVKSVYLTEESDTYHANVTWIGDASTTDGSSATIYEESVITVLDITDANAVEEVQKKLKGFEFGTVWKIGTTGKPELIME